MTAGEWPGPAGPGSARNPESGSPPIAIPLTPRWVAAATGGRIRGETPLHEFSGVSIDTRTLAPGELFVAIRGERFDGAEFIGAAIDAGASGIVVERGQARPVDGATAGRTSAGPVVIEVEDAIVALQALARAVRREAGARVVAITGSAGKTTTKEVTAEFLAERYRVMRNRGNLNNHIGLPLSLIELRHRPDVAVVELGMNHAGEISTLVHVAEPEVRVWTNVGEAHLGYFASIEGIAEAKAEIFEGASRSSLLVANADDERIVHRAPRFAGRIVTFGIERDADVRATDVSSRGVEGTVARVTTPRGSFELTTPLIGTGNLANVLAATAVAVEFDVPLPAIAARAATLRPAAHRGEVLRLADNVTVIDDSYNANPTATIRALAVLAAATDRPRRVAILGEMLELGDHAISLHEEIGRVAAAGTDLLFAIGGSPARAMSEAAVAAGMAPSSVQYFPTSDEAADAIAASVRAGDVLLVKGSRGIRADRVVERLKAELG